MNEYGMMKYQREYKVDRFPGLKLRVLDKTGRAVFVMGEKRVVPEFPADITVVKNKLWVRRRPPILPAWVPKIKLQKSAGQYGQRQKVGTLKGSRLVLDEVLVGRWRKLTLLGHKVSYDRMRQDQLFTLHQTQMTSFRNQPLARRQKKGETRNPGRWAVDLVPWIMPSPFQADANSCLFMAVSGAAELGLVRTEPSMLRGSWDDRDLSERFLMNAYAKPGTPVSSWRTDLVYAYNHHGGSLRNTQYRFTKGHYRWETPPGSYSSSYPVACDDSHPQATYGAYYNWIDELTPELLDDVVDLPTLGRDVIYDEPTGDLWAVAKMERGHLTAVQDALMRSQPVVVIYNHYGTWHAVLIVAFMDHYPTAGDTVDSWLEYMADEADRLEASGSYEDGRRAASYRDKVAQVSEARAEFADLEGQGTFWIRDSIYPNPYGGPYDYDPNYTGDEENYSYPLIQRDYLWLLCLASSAVAITW